ncbi:hypothetical protein [Cetobacterium sp. SF1]|uniref:hypothetical protein n=1 Tax=Cetobacterium sp. SF1 TaxID=3417654 RepID=UPI003CFAE5F2
MKKILVMMTLVNFLIGCNQNQSKDIMGKNTVVEKVESSNKNNNIYNKNSMETLEKLKKNLKILYTYSTEKRYDFSYPNKYLGILENNDYAYMSYSENSIYTFVKINLENFQSSIILGNNYNERSIEISQEDFSKLIKKLREISISTKFFNSEEEMEIIIFDDIAGKVQNQNINTKIILEKKGNESDVVFKNLADDSSLFTFDLKIIEILGAENNSDTINQVINKYSDVLLEKIINLGQKYEQLNYLVKNSKEIVSYLNNESTNFKYVDFLEYNKIREYNLDINYYSSGRVKSIGDYEFENNSNSEVITKDIKLLKENLENIKTREQLNYYNKNIFNIIYFVQKEELNLNPTEKDKENLKKLKDEIIPIFNKLDKIV